MLNILHSVNTRLSPGKSLIKTMIVKSMDNLNIFNNPKSVLSMIDNNILSKIKLGPYEVQGRGGIVKLQVDQGLNKNFEITSFKKLDVHYVVAWFPAFKHKTCGVVESIDKAMDLDSFLLN